MGYGSSGGGSVAVGVPIATYNAEVAARKRDKINNFYGELSQHRHRKPMLTIIDDDGYDDVYTDLLPLSISLDIPMVAAICTDPAHIHMSLAQLNALKAAGWDVVSHTATHVDLTTLTDDQMRTEMESSRDWLFANGFTHDVLVYPYGGVNANVRGITREYYRAGVDVDSQNSVNYPPIVTYQLKRIDLNVRGLTAVKAKIDEAVASNGWIILMTHHYSDLNWTIEDFTDMVTYAQTAGMEIVNITDGLNNIGNIIDTGNVGSVAGNTICLDCDGKIHGNLLGKVIYVLNGHSGIEITNGSLPSYFEAGKVTFSNISEALAVTAGFPETKAGTIYTYRLSPSSDEYTYQEFWIAGSDRRYTRFYNTTIVAWGAWNVATPLGIPATGIYNALSTPTDFANKITVHNVAGNTTGYPSTLGGTVTTIAVATSNSWTFQIFKELGTSSMWTRYYTTEWSNWELISNCFSKPRNTVTPSTPITDFSQGITITYVNTAGATGFPDDLGGILTTYRQDTSTGWSYQEYKKYNSWDKYIRYLVSGGSWSEWKQFAYTT